MHFWPHVVIAKRCLRTIQFYYIVKKIQQNWWTLIFSFAIWFHHLELKMKLSNDQLLLAFLILDILREEIISFASTNSKIWFLNTYVLFILGKTRLLYFMLWMNYLCTLKFDLLNMWGNSQPSLITYSCISLKSFKQGSIMVYMYAVLEIYSSLNGKEMCVVSQHSPKM